MKRNQIKLTSPDKSLDLHDYFKAKLQGRLTVLGTTGGKEGKGENKSRNKSKQKTRLKGEKKVFNKGKVTGMGEKSRVRLEKSREKSRVSRIVGDKKSVNREESLLKSLREKIRKL